MPTYKNTSRTIHKRLLSYRAAKVSYPTEKIEFFAFATKYNAKASLTRLLRGTIRGAYSYSFNSL